MRGVARGQIAGSEAAGSLPTVHPIERLRYVARASGAPQGTLVRETAAALGSLAFDPAGLVTACRRVLDRHPASGPLWWLAARVLTTIGDPDEEGWRCADELDDDTTVDALVHALPDDARVCVLGWPELAGEALARRGDLEVLAVDALDEGSGLVRQLRYAGVDATDVPVSGLGSAVANAGLVLLEASAASPSGIVAVAGSRAAAAVARQAGVPVWAVVGLGRRLPAPLFGALLARIEAEHPDEPWESTDEVVPSELLDCVAGPVGAIDPGLALAQADCPVAAELLRGAAPVIRRRLLVALLVVAGAGACGGGGSASQPFADHDHDTSFVESDDVAVDEPDEPDEAEETDEAPTEVAVAVPQAYAVDGALEVEDFTVLVSGVIVDPQHYALLYASESFVVRRVRDGDAVYVARAVDMAVLDTRPFIQTDAVEGTALGLLQQRVEEGPDPEANVAGADISVDALLELLLTDPAALLDLDALAGAADPRPIAVPDAVAAPVEAIGLEPPPLEAAIEVDGGELTWAEVFVGGSVVEYRLAVLYTDHGEPTVAELGVPSADRIDATPWVEEEALRAFAGSALLAPAALPAAIVLVGAVVLDAAETIEGCEQVELDYTTPPDQPLGPESLTLFLLPQACATAADPTAFDETFGGFPARGAGAEVLIQSTVVQVQPSDALSPEAVEAAVASIVPVTAEQLIAAVVPSD